MRSTLFAAASATILLLAASQSAGAADLYAPAPPAPPAPAPYNPWYVSLFGGASVMEDVDASASGTFGGTDYAFDGELSSDWGFLIGGAVGRSFGSMRGEVELSYSENDFDKAKGRYTEGADTDRISDPVGGDTGTAMVLANLWYDFNRGAAFRPYVGGGAGLGFTDVSVKVDDLKLVDDDDLGFGFQLGAGMRYALTESVDLDVSYRFRGVLGVKATGDYSAGADSASARVKDDIYSHNVVAGISYHFTGF